MPGRGRTQLHQAACGLIQSRCRTHQGWRLHSPYSCALSVLLWRFFLLDLIRISHVETCHHYTRPLLCMKDLPRNLSLSTKDFREKGGGGTWEKLPFITCVHLEVACKLLLESSTFLLSGIFICLSIILSIIIRVKLKYNMFLVYIQLSLYGP